MLLMQSKAASIMGSRFLEGSLDPDQFVIDGEEGDTDGGQSQQTADVKSGFVPFPFIGQGSSDGEHTDEDQNDSHVHLDVSPAFRFRFCVRRAPLRYPAPIGFPFSMFSILSCRWQGKSPGGHSFRWVGPETETLRDLPVTGFFTDL